MAQKACSCGGIVSLESGNAKFAEVLSRAPYAKAILYPCEPCGLLHWVDGKPFVSLLGQHAVYLDDENIVLIQEEAA
jgi:hypothetical protein